MEATLQSLGSSKRRLCIGVVRRVLVVRTMTRHSSGDGCRLVHREDRDTLPQTRPYSLIQFITWKIQYDSDKCENRKPTFNLRYEHYDRTTIKLNIRRFKILRLEYTCFVWSSRICIPSSSLSGDGRSNCRRTVECDEDPLRNSSSLCHSGGKRCSSSSSTWRINCTMGTSS